jgi:mono/diheme cytochrome c family protein
MEAGAGRGCLARVKVKVALRDGTPQDFDFDMCRSLGPKWAEAARRRRWRYACAMPSKPLRRVAPLLALFLAVAARAQAVPSYAEVAPIFAERCTMCHSGPSAAAGLRLDSLESLLKGSARGPVVKSGAPAASELVRRIKGLSQPRMPLTGPPFLADADVARIEGWIAGGLRPGAAAAPAAPSRAALPPRPAPGEPVTYAHVAPIFATRCAKCHTDNGLMGPAPEGFMLNAYAATLAAADRLRVVPGHPAASELLRRIRGQALPRMPFDGPPYLDDAETQLIEAWIRQGARASDGTPAPLPAGAALRLHGTLDAAGGLDGLPLAIGPGTRIDKRPAPGDYVQVRGRIDAAGRVIVERLRPRQAR